MIMMQSKLSILWIAVMLTYLLGDVLRIISSGVTPGEMDGTKINQAGYLGIAVLMVVPILMVVLNLFLPQPVSRWVNIIMAGFWFLFNLMSLGGYKPFDIFLLIVSMVFNLITIWLAWGWK